MGKIEEQQLENWFKELQSRDFDRKTRALNFLKDNVKQKEVRDGLITMASDLNIFKTPFRAELVKFLCQRGKLSLEELDMFRRDSNEIIRREAVRCFAKRGGEKSVKYLLKSLEDPYQWVRLFALRGLVKIRGYDKTDPKFRSAIIKMLGDGDEINRKEALRIVERFGEKATPELIEAFKSGNKLLKYSTLGILGRIGNQEANEFLIQNLKSGNPRIKRIALRYVGNNQLPEAVPNMLDIYKKEKDFQTSIEIALGKIGTKAIPQLIAQYSERPQLQDLIVSTLNNGLPAGRLTILKELKKIPKQEARTLKSKLKLDEN